MNARDALTATERAMLGYALDLAQDQIHSRGDEFTADDQAALDTLRCMADAGPDTTTPDSAADRGAITEALHLLESAPEAFSPTPSANIAAAANVLRRAHELGGGA